MLEGHKGYSEGTSLPHFQDAQREKAGGIVGGERERERERDCLHLYSYVDLKDIRDAHISPPPPPLLRMCARNCKCILILHASPVQHVYSHCDGCDIYSYVSKSPLHACTCAHTHTHTHTHILPHFAVNGSGSCYQCNSFGTAHSKERAYCSTEASRECRTGIQYADHSHRRRALP